MASSSKHSKLIHIESAHTHLHTITNADFDRRHNRKTKIGFVCLGKSFTEKFMITNEL